MPQFNETELTEAVISSFDKTPDPRAKFLLQELVKSLHDYVRKTDLTFEEWELRDRFPDPDRPEMHPDPAGVHPAVRRARRLDAGRCGQPSRARRRHRDHGARPVLCRRTQGDAAWHGHLRRTWPASGCSCRAASPTSRASRWPACPSMSGTPTTTASTIPRSRTMRAGAVVAGALHHRCRRPVLLPHYPAVQLSDPDRRPGRRDDPADPAATRCGRRMCTFWSMRRATSR